MTILVNKIRCKKCGEEIESIYTHDFRSCKCGTCAVDGGHDYLRRFGKIVLFLIPKFFEKGAVPTVGYPVFPLPQVPQSNQKLVYPSGREVWFF